MIFWMVSASTGLVDRSCCGHFCISVTRFNREASYGRSDFSDDILAGLTISSLLNNVACRIQSPNKACVAQLKSVSVI